MDIADGDRGQVNEPRDVSEMAKLQKDLLWGQYLEYRMHARHAETTRTSAINFVILITSGLIAVITLDQKVQQNDLPMTLVITALGLTSTLFSVSYAERYYRNTNRGRCVTVELDRRFFADQEPAHHLSGLRDDADEHPVINANKRVVALTLLAFRMVGTSAASTHVFWLILPFMIFGIGIVLTVLALLD